jgi:hypothetical protein
VQSSQLKKKSVVTIAEKNQAGHGQYTFYLKAQGNQFAAMVAPQS